MHFSFVYFILSFTFLVIHESVSGQREPLSNSGKYIPHIEKRGKVTQLIVDGKPFLILGGELRNSSSSSLDYLNPIWANMVSMNMNTALVAVPWDMIELEEGKFNFNLVDNILKGARDHKLRLILLWFGSWKNGFSHYAPQWVKEDYKRFPRIKLKNGKATETISPFSKECLKVESHAFASFMKHLAKVDTKDRTVIMIQVENEVGVFGDSRDRSAIADSAFNNSVPKEIINYLKKNKHELQPALRTTWESFGAKNSGRWEDVFGNGHAAEEIFMAWNYAQYVNAVSKAGKTEYPIPMFVNAWIMQRDDEKPGDYPSGGPQTHVHDIWRIGAPKIDILTPDIYRLDFKNIMGMYHHSWNPLFIPESRASSGVSNAFYAFGQHDAIGYSPFGFETVADSIKEVISKGYKMLSDMSPMILEAQSKGVIAGVFLNKDDSVQTINIGGYTLESVVNRPSRITGFSEIGYGLIINPSYDKYIIAGFNMEVTFKPSTPGPAFAGLASVWEGVYENGHWKRGRKLNGDNVMINYKIAQEVNKGKTGSGAKFEGKEPQILNITLYRFE